MTTTRSPQELLELLADPKSRAIIAAVAQERRSVSEISDYCDLPLSTTYRRVDTLVENDVVENALRIKDSGRHEKEYTLSSESVSAVFRVDDSVDIRVSFDATDRERPYVTSDGAEIVGLESEPAFDESGNSWCP